MPCLHGEVLFNERNDGGLEVHASSDRSLSDACDTLCAVRPLTLQRLIQTDNSTIISIRSQSTKSIKLTAEKSSFLGKVSKFFWLKRVINVITLFKDFNVEENKKTNFKPRKNIQIY